MSTVNLDLLTTSQGTAMGDYHCFGGLISASHYNHQHGSFSCCVSSQGI